MGRGGRAAAGRQGHDRACQAEDRAGSAAAATTGDAAREQAAERAADPARREWNSDQPMTARSLVMFVVVAVASPAHGQPAAAQAEVLFRNGKRLLKQGQVPEACASFDASQKLVHRPPGHRSSPASRVGRPPA